MLSPDAIAQVRAAVRHEIAAALADDAKTLPLRLHVYAGMDQRAERIEGHIDEKVGLLFGGLGVARDDLAIFLDERTDRIEAELAEGDAA